MLPLCTTWTCRNRSWVGGRGIASYPICRASLTKLSIQLFAVNILIDCFYSCLGYMHFECQFCSLRCELKQRSLNKKYKCQITFTFYNLSYFVWVVATVNKYYITNYYQQNIRNTQTITHCNVTTKFYGLFKLDALLNLT